MTRRTARDGTVIFTLTREELIAAFKRTLDELAEEAEHNWRSCTRETSRYGCTTCSKVEMLKSRALLAYDKALQGRTKP